MRNLAIIFSLIAISACSVASKELSDTVRHKTANTLYAAVCGLSYPTEEWLISKHQVTRKEYQAFCGRKSAR